MKRLRRIGPLPNGMVGVKISVETYRQSRDIIFDHREKLFPGMWLDPVGFGMPLIVGFDEDSEREAFCDILTQVSLEWELIHTKTKTKTYY